MDWQWIVGPAVGSVIGYITNDIAVRMLFRPHAQKRLFGRRVPFTPGLIPKERARLARAIREVLDAELLSVPVMEEALLSGRMLEKIGLAADQAMEDLQAEARTPRVLLEGLVGAEALGAFEADATRAARIFLMEKLLESGIEKTAAALVVAEAKKKMQNSAAAVLTLFWDEKRSLSMEEKLAQSIREMLAEHGPRIIDGVLGDAVRGGVDVPVGTLVARHGGRLGDVRGFVMAQYTALIRRALPAALESLELGAIVEDKLNALPMAELEGLIMQVMRKELRAIVWLGALLGAIMGVVTALF